MKSLLLDHRKPILYKYVLLASLSPNWHQKKGVRTICRPNALLDSPSQFPICDMSILYSTSTELNWTCCKTIRTSYIMAIWFRLMSVKWPNLLVKESVAISPRLAPSPAPSRARYRPIHIYLPTNWLLKARQQQIESLFYWYMIDWWKRGNSKTRSCLSGSLGSRPRPPRIM